jgi:hypothetical protein
MKHTLVQHTREAELQHTSRRDPGKFSRRAPTYFLDIRNARIRRSPWFPYRKRCSLPSIFLYCRQARWENIHTSFGPRPIVTRSKAGRASFSSLFSRGMSLFLVTTCLLCPNLGRFADDISWSWGSNRIRQVRWMNGYRGTHVYQNLQWMR